MKNCPQNGDILLVDLGMVAKIRPCLVLCANPDSERTVSLVAPLTCEVRRGESEIPFPKPPWLMQKSSLSSGASAVSSITPITPPTSARTAPTPIAHSGRTQYLDNRRLNFD